MSEIVKISDAVALGIHDEKSHAYFRETSLADLTRIIET